jgi:single-strand DNA-binding protein
MPDYNKVILVGRLTKDPVVPNSDKELAFLSLAINRKYKSGEEWVEETTFIDDIVVFGKQAKVVSEHLSKGRAILVEGRLQTRKEKDTGHSKLSIVMDSFNFLDSSK